MTTVFVMKCHVVKWIVTAIVMGDFKMSDNSFEDKFPSLRTHGLSGNQLVTDYSNHERWELYTKELIQEFCIDKTRLKEAIDNLEKKLDISLERHGIRRDLRIPIIGRNLLKFEAELGLIGENEKEVK